MKSLFLVLTVLASISPAFAAGIANDMTCAQTQAVAATYGRVYVRTYTGDVVPVYGFNRKCDGMDRAYPFWVKTLDNKTCVIGHRCVSAGTR